MTFGMASFSHFPRVSRSDTEIPPTLPSIEGFRIPSPIPGGSNVCLCVCVGGRGGYSSKVRVLPLSLRNSLQGRQLFRKQDASL